MLDDQEINDAMTEAALVEAGAERNQAWADINKMIVEQAVGDPVRRGTTTSPCGRRTSRA